MVAISKFFVAKSLMTAPSNVLSLYVSSQLSAHNLKVEGDGMESRLSS